MNVDSLVTRPAAAPSDLAILARILAKPDERLADQARHFGVSRQRVYRAIGRGAKAGVLVDKARVAA